MRFSRCNLLRCLPLGWILTTLGLTGCGNSCFAGFSVNGNGGVIIRAGNPPPSCPLSQTMGNVKIAAVKSPPRQNCPADNCIEHLFITVRSIRLRTNVAVGLDSTDEFELVPLLVDEPRQFDLLGEPPKEILAESAAVPAGSYKELRLEFAANTKESHDVVHKNSCGGESLNCIVLRDGRVESLDQSGEATELMIPFIDAGRSSLVVLPDSQIEVRLNLEPRLAFANTAEGIRVHYKLAGRADVEAEQPAASEAAIPK